MHRLNSADNDLPLLTGHITKGEQSSNQNSETEPCPGQFYVITPALVSMIIDSFGLLINFNVTVLTRGIRRFIL